MFRLINGVTVAGVRVCPTPKLRSLPSSPFLVSPSASRSIYAIPGSLTRAFKTRQKMTEVIPQTRPLSQVEIDPGEILTSVEKKPRLDVETEQAVASTSTAGAASRTTKQKQANGEKQSKKKASKKKKKQLPPEPYSRDDVLWRDVRDLLGPEAADQIIEEGKEWESPFQYGEEVEVEVSAISSTGTPLSHLSLSAWINLIVVSFIR